jgi:hypothetical protein
MKTSILLLMAGLLYSTCIGRAFNNESSFKSTDKEYSFIQEYKVTSPVTLKISTSGGNIRTTCREGDVVEVAFVVEKRNQVLDITLEELKKIAEVEIINGNNSLEINIKKTFERNLSIGFIIKTPLNSSCNLNTSGGNVSVSDLKGEQDLNTSGGNINLKNLTGQTKANTSGGNISMNNINGKLRVSTSGGNIEANDTKPELTAQTSGGNIRLKNIEGNVDVNTSGGSISLNEISGSVKAITSGGNISADIIKLTEKLELETSGGDIRATIPSGLGLNLDLSAENIETPLANFTGSAKKDRIKGQMNGGGIPVRLATSGGSVTLNYK